MSRYDSLAYRQRTGQMTADDYRTERNNVLKQLTVATRQNAELAVELEQAFNGLEEARATNWRQQESIDIAHTYLEEAIEYAKENGGEFVGQHILDALNVLKGENA
jgi:hypothetical protein